MFASWESADAEVPIAVAAVCGAGTGGGSRQRNSFLTVSLTGSSKAVIALGTLFQVGGATNVPLVDVPLSSEVECDDPALSMNTKFLLHFKKIPVKTFVLHSVSTPVPLILEYCACSH